jgi:MFS family permease
MPDLSPSPSGAPDHPPAPVYPLFLLIALAALAFMDRQILAVLVQPVKAEFGLTDLQIGLITGLGFALSFAVLGIPLGKLADRGQRIRVLSWSRGLGAVLGASAAWATGFWTLLISRSGSAVSEAGGGPAAISLVSDMYPPERRSRVISLLGMGATLGSLMALVIGAWLAQAYGWRFTLGAVGGSILVVTLVLRFTVTEPPRQGVAPPAGAARGGTRELWQRPVTRWLIAGACCALVAGYGFGAWNNALLIRHHGLSVRDAGWLSGGAALTSMLGGLLSGWLTDRMAQRDARWQLGVPIVGLLLALPCGLTYLMMPAGQLPWAAGLMLCFGFFIVWWAAPVYAALSFLVPPDRRASAHSVMLLVGSVLGSGLGPIFTGWLSDTLNAVLPGDGLRFALMVMIGMLLPGVYAFSRVMPLYPHARVSNLRRVVTVGNGALTP